MPNSKTHGKNRRQKRKEEAKSGVNKTRAAFTAEEISTAIWSLGAEPASEDSGGWDELVASEMLGLFAQQSSWTVRNRLVGHKADVVSYEIGMEVITQRQDMQTQALVGETGGVVWDAAVVLSRFVCRHATAIGLPIGDSARWLELGAGCGAVGIAASKLLPVPVVLSDQESILPILQKNLHENRCSARTTLALLEWGKDGESSVEEKGGGFDVIVGADCVFNENLIDLLIETLLRFAGRDTTILMAMELREPSVTSAFLHAAAKAFGECRRVTLSTGMFATGFPPQTDEEVEAAQKEWSGSPVIIYALRKPRHLGPDPEPEPEPEPEAAGVDESVEVTDEEQEEWIEIERLLKLVKPLRLQNAVTRRGQIRAQLLTMTPEARAVAVDRLAAALDQ